MKPGTYNIPAIEFKIGLTNDTSLKYDGLDYGTRDTHLYDFSQVDGLTLGQIFLLFNPFSSNHKIGLFALVDVTPNKNKGDKSYHSALSLVKDVDNYDLDVEVSEYFEGELKEGIQKSELTHHDPNFFPQDILDSFIERYRGRPLRINYSGEEQERW